MLTREEIQKMFHLEDKDGNRLTCDHHLNLYLSLQSEVRVRNIGRIYADTNGNLYYEKRDDEKHIFRKNYSWSIHYEVLKRVNFIKLMTKKRKYWIRQDDAVKHGSFMHFRASGMEKKLYIPVKNWTKQEYAIPAFDHDR